MRHNFYRGGMVVGLVALILVIVVEVFAAPAARSDGAIPIGLAPGSDVGQHGEFHHRLSGSDPGWVDSSSRHRQCR